jgi:radical SAM protein with 4Fe4S-binding SPASM domain
MNRFTLQWHITNKCYNRCKHCYINQFGHKEVPLASVDDILFDFSNCCKTLNARPIVAITGGDPLLHSNFMDIIAKARTCSNWLGVLGNPECIDSKVAKELKEAGINQFQLSIDGMNDTHDSIRSPGSFQRTVNAVHELKKANIPVSIMSTVSSVNHTEMVDVMNLAYELKVNKWAFARWTPNAGDCGLSPEDYRDFLLNIMGNHKKFDALGIKLPAKDPLLGTLQTKPIQASKIIGGCGLGTSKLTLLHDNTIMACRRHAGSTLGTWEENGDFIKNFLYHPLMQQFRKINDIQGCNKCDYLYQCRGCRASAYSMTGNSFARDPQCFIDTVAVKMP